MLKKTGVHLYFNIKNLENIIKEEENKDEDLKRTLHMLQTYFVGLTKLVKDKGGQIEKYTSGRAHIVFEVLEGENIQDTVVEAMCACFIYVNDIFNKLSKYSQYTNFVVHAGVDYGEYYDYEIEDDKITSIGSVANVSAKIQSYATKNNIYATKKFIEKLDDEFAQKFNRLDDTENSELYTKVKIKNIYEIQYLDIFEEEKNIEILNSLKNVRSRVEEETRDINLKDITFEDVTKKLSFENLSLKGKNKRIDNGAIICADIRGFTKLFTVSGSNLDDLKDIMSEIYSIMGEAVDDYNGTLIQYQGDRLVAIYHNYDTESDCIVRIIEAALTLKKKIIDLANKEEIKEKINNKEISIGIGCSIGKVIATRLGMNRNKDNIILGQAYKYSNKAEDVYAEKNQIVISKTLKEELDLIANDENNENVKYEVLQDMFNAISTTGYYLTELTLEEYENKINERLDEKKAIEQAMSQQFNSRGGVRPFGKY